MRFRFPARAQVAGAIAAVVLALLFVTVNRGAYRSYFMDDDLDNIAWTQQVPAAGFLNGFLSPRYYPNHFRPVAHFAYHVMGSVAGLDYRWYVALIHALHFANTALLWGLLRRLGIAALPAGAGALFFVFHMTLFDALWKPMFQFDVWCALFCLLSLHCWISRWWALSFLCFWAAYKAKEHAVMLPAAIAAYEWWLGEKRWRVLIPFGLVSASFGIQAALANRATTGDYELRLSALSILRTAVYYGTRVLLLPYAGFLLLLLPRRFPDRRLWFGLAFAALLLAPMLALPSRLSGAYLYAPMLGVAVAMGVAAERLHWGFAAAFFALWLPLNFESMREQRKPAIAFAHDNRAYVEGLRELPSRYPSMRRFVYDGRPPGLQPWGILGALRFYYGTTDIEIHSVESKNLHEMFTTGGVTLLIWDPPRRQLTTVAREPGSADASYLRMTRPMPLWQLEDGWYSLEGHYRWTKPVATARLYRPPDAKFFDVSILVGPQYIAGVKRGRLDVLLDGRPIGATEYTDHGWRTARFELAPGPGGSVRVEFRATPAFRPSPADRELGIAMGAFGFAAAGEPPREYP